jgi:hypothetical protein
MPSYPPAVNAKDTTWLDRGLDFNQTDLIGKFLEDELAAAVRTHLKAVSARKSVGARKLPSLSPFGPSGRA